MAASKTPLDKINNIDEDAPLNRLKSALNLCTILSPTVLVSPIYLNAWLVPALDDIMRTSLAWQINSIDQRILGLSNFNTTAKNLHDTTLHMVMIDQILLYEAFS